MEIESCREGSEIIDYESADDKVTVLGCTGERERERERDDVWATEAMCKHAVCKWSDGRMGDLQQCGHECDRAEQWS